MQGEKTFASSSPSLQLHAQIFARSSDELTIQHVFWDAPVGHSMDMAKPSQTPLA